jgi:hypothetical protein
MSTFALNERFWPVIQRQRHLNLQQKGSQRWFWAAKLEPVFVDFGMGLP